MSQLILDVDKNTYPLHSASKLALSAFLYTIIHFQTKSTATLFSINHLPCTKQSSLSISSAFSSLIPSHSTKPNHFYLHPFSPLLQITAHRPSRPTMTSILHRQSSLFFFFQRHKSRKYQHAPLFAEALRAKSSARRRAIIQSTLKKFYYSVENVFPPNSLLSGIY